jgi:hypothetical protein
MAIIQPQVACFLGLFLRAIHHSKGPKKEGSVLPCFVARRPARPFPRCCLPADLLRTRERVACCVVMMVVRAWLLKQ